MRNIIRPDLSPALRGLISAVPAIAVAASASLLACRAGVAPSQPTLALFSFAVSARRGRL